MRSANKVCPEEVQAIIPYYDDDFSHISKQERLETIPFIEVYRKFPILWNPHLPDSHSFKAKRKAIDDMPKLLTDKYLMPMNTAIVRQKIKNIRNQYNSHFKKIESGIQSNLWFAPHLDEFLKEHIKTSLRRVHTDEPVKELPLSFDLPFRVNANIPLNIIIIMGNNFCFGRQLIIQLERVTDGT